MAQFWVIMPPEAIKSARHAKFSHDFEISNQNEKFEKCPWKFWNFFSSLVSPSHKARDAAAGHLLREIAAMMCLVSDKKVGKIFSILRIKS